MARALKRSYAANLGKEKGGSVACPQPAEGIISRVGFANFARWLRCDAHPSNQRRRGLILRISASQLPTCTTSPTCFPVSALARGEM